MFQHHFALEYFGIKGVKWLISSQTVPPLTGRWTQRPAGMSTSSSLQWVDQWNCGQSIAVQLEKPNNSS